MSKYSPPPVPVDEAIVWLPANFSLGGSSHAAILANGVVKRILYVDLAYDVVRLHGIDELSSDWVARIQAHIDQRPTKPSRRDVAAEDRIHQDLVTGVL